jgi:5-methylcytosine-specific restriction endonuclease McrA
MSIHKTLILNSTFQPLSLATPKRALALLFSKKINVLKESDVELRSIEQTIAIPKVAVLTYYVRAPYARRVALNRENIFIRDSFSCQYCGEDAESIDHIMPKSKGGSHEWSNVVACCKKCNLLKADKLLSKTSLNLKKIPSIPEGNFWIKTIIGNNPDPDWKEYLVIT